MCYPKISLFGHQQTNTEIFILLSCTIHCNFHCVSSLFNFHVSFYQSHTKVNGVNQAILFGFRKRLTISRFKVQTATAGNEKRDTLTNMISIQFQNFDFFLWALLWSRWSLDIDKFHKKYQQWGSLFWLSRRLLVCKFTLNVFLRNYFPRFSLRFVVIYQTLKIFLENIFPRKTWLWQLTVVRFSQYSFPQKLYIQGWISGSEKI